MNENVGLEVVVLVVRLIFEVYTVGNMPIYYEEEIIEYLEYISWDIE